MTGSGMGCPDWPKCFGQWVPPTDISQLPVDYKTRFEVAGREIADFDAFKTWVEYVNRLIGVLIGLFSLGTVVAAFPLRKTHRGVWAFSLAGFLGVLVVGGVGAYVVRTHLQGGIVTIHMMLALGVLALFIAAWSASYKQVIAHQKSRLSAKGNRVKWLGAAAMLLVIIQIIMGTQVREGVDLMAEALGEEARGSWLDNLGAFYGVHKRFQYAVVGAILLLGRELKDWLSDWKLGRNVYLGILASVGAAIGLGLGMHHLDIPQWMQPGHLLIATLLFGTVWGVNILIWIKPAEATPQVSDEIERDAAEQPVHISQSS